MGRVSTLIGGALLVSALVFAGWRWVAPDEVDGSAGAGIDLPGGGVRSLTLPDPVILPRPTPGPVMLLRVGESPLEVAAVRREPPWWAGVTTDGLAALVRDLRDDDVRNNATDASGELASLLHSPRLGAEARLRLEAALDSYDVQQRYFAARILASGVRHDLFEPSPGLIGVQVDLMCGGRLRGSPAIVAEMRRSMCRPVTGAIDFLLANVDAAEPQLLDVLGRDDEESGFLASFVLAMGGKVEHVDRLAPRLIGRFADNDVRYDGSMALNAVVRLGQAAEWWLQVSVGGDPQHEATRHLALAYVRHEGQAPDGVIGRLNRLTNVVADPVRDWRFEFYRMPGW